MSGPGGGMRPTSPHVRSPFCVRGPLTRPVWADPRATGHWQWGCPSARTADFGRGLTDAGSKRTRDRPSPAPVLRIPCVTTAPPIVWTAPPSLRRFVMAHPICGPGPTRLRAGHSRQGTGHTCCFPISSHSRFSSSFFFRSSSKAVSSSCSAWADF